VSTGRPIIFTGFLPTHKAERRKLSKSRRTICPQMWGMGISPREEESKECTLPALSRIFAEPSSSFFPVSESR